MWNPDYIGYRWESICKVMGFKYKEKAGDKSEWKKHKKLDPPKASAWQIGGQDDSGDWIVVKWGHKGSSSNDIIKPSATYPKVYNHYKPISLSPDPSNNSNNDTTTTPIAIADSIHVNPTFHGYGTNVDAPSPYPHDSGIHGVGQIIMMCPPCSSRIT